MIIYGFDLNRPIRELQDLLEYETGILPKIRKTFQTIETEHELFLPVFGASLPKDAFYFRRFEFIEWSDLRRARQQLYAWQLLIVIFAKSQLQSFVFPWDTQGHKCKKVCTDKEVERVRQEYLFKQNYCDELALKKWVQPLEGTRCCAYCLIKIDHDRAKECGGCNKRAYCSKDCQRIDWKSDDGGQNHKYWCKVGACEEGVEWEVVQVPGKGLGIVAKAFIPKNACHC